MPEQKPLRCKGWNITFAEVPDEITLVFSVCGCPYKCEGCHSSYLWNEDNSELLMDIIDDVIAQYKDMASCLCVMGGNWNEDELKKIAVKAHENNMKFCLYSGSNIFPSDGLMSLLDYVKIGHYDKTLGGLACKETNQRFYKITVDHTEDITYKFWREAHD